jgi:hypothetical protein
VQGLSGLQPHAAHKSGGRRSYGLTFADSRGRLARGKIQTYRLDLDDIAVLLRSERQYIAAWFIGASPPPESVHTLLFSLGTPPNARPARGLQQKPAT